MSIKLLLTKDGEATNKVIKEYKDLEEAENRYEWLRDKAIRRYLDKIDFDATDMLEGEDIEEYISLMLEHFR